MFLNLLYIHLFRPFLKYNQNTSPLPAHVSPRKLCTQAAATISKLLRLYKRSHGLRQIVNVAVYILHTACTIHLLNLPEKNARRDIIHGVKHLEEMAEGWLCARRTLRILSVLAKKWKVELPEEAATVLQRTDAKFGIHVEAGTPRAITSQPQPPSTTTSPALQSYSMAIPNTGTTFFDQRGNPMSSLASSNSLHRLSEPRSLPPNDSIPFPRAQRHPSELNPSTPSSSGGRGRNSVDSNTGNSPSQMFGGVEALLREGQDWWLRDQSQLAMGFDNWNFAPEDMTWFSGQSGTSPAAIASPAAATNAYTTTNTSPVMNGDVNPGANGVNGYGGYGGALNYNENEWYQ